MGADHGGWPRTWCYGHNSDPVRPIAQQERTREYKKNLPGHVQAFVVKRVVKGFSVLLPTLTLLVFFFFFTGSPRKWDSRLPSDGVS